MEKDDVVKRADLLCSIPRPGGKINLTSREDKIKEMFFNRAESIDKGRKFFYLYQPEIVKGTDTDVLVLRCSDEHENIKVELPKSGVPLVILCQNSFIESLGLRLTTTANCNVTSRCVIKRDENAIFNLWLTVDYYNDNYKHNSICSKRIMNGKHDIVIAYSVYDLDKLKCSYKLLGATIGEDFVRNNYDLIWDMEFKGGDVIEGGTI